MRTACLALSLSLWFAAAACGDGTQPATTADASPPDAPNDAPNDAHAVRVTVTQGGAAVSGLTVYFLEADNTLVATRTTDAGGHASAELHAGGSVTVQNPALTSFADAFALESWVGVQPGDDLALDLPVFRAPVSLTVSAPVATLAGVASYRVLAACGATNFFLAGQTPILALDARCTGDKHTADFTVFAQDANERDIAAFVAPDVGIADQQHVALTGTYQPLIDVPIGYAHLGAEQDVAVAASAASSHGLMNVANVSLHSATGSVTGTFPWPAQLTTGTRVIQSYPGPEADKEVLSWAPVAASVSLDLADQLGQGITSQATFDDEHRHIAWTLAADGAPAQVAVASFELDEGGGTYVGWTIIAPGATPQIAVPQLPAGVVDLSGGAGVSLSLLRVPGGAASWTQLLGAGGFLAGFSGLIAGSPSGSVSFSFPPGIPL